MPDVTHEAFYDHPGCGCRDYDQKPHAHCVTCGESFSPEVDYGEPYRFCPVCGVEFTICRWRTCVDRSRNAQRKGEFSQFVEQRQRGWQMDSRSTLFDVDREWEFDRGWEDVNEWGMDDRDRIMRFLRVGHDNGTPTEAYRYGQYLMFSDGWGEYRFYYTAPRPKLPG
jgi:hypothetical protein